MSQLFKRYEVSTINNDQLVQSSPVTFAAHLTEKQVRERVADQLRQLGHRVESVLLSNPVIVELV